MQREGERERGREGEDRGTEGQGPRRDGALIQVRARTDEFAI
jgi:hypothetical protein